MHLTQCGNLIPSIMIPRQTCLYHRRCFILRSWIPTLQIQCMLWIIIGSKLKFQPRAGGYCSSACPSTPLTSFPSHPCSLFPFFICFFVDLPAQRSACCFFQVQPSHVQSRLVLGHSWTNLRDVPGHVKTALSSPTFLSPTSNVNY